jgi:hypothetical protein
LFHLGVWISFEYQLLRQQLDLTNESSTIATASTATKAAAAATAVTAASNAA